MDAKTEIRNAETSKAEIVHSEKMVGESVALSSNIDEKKLLRKLDWGLLPWLSVLYLLSFLDRTAIGNASTFGLRKSLGMTDDQYNIALTAFFFSYSLFEPPSNVLLKRLKPNVWLSGIMFLWGICMLAQGLVTNYGQLVAVRVLLGLTEAGLFPGVMFYLSCWYTREEYGLRGALFFSSATLSGAFGGLLAAALSKLHAGGYEGWRWILIIEGIITVACAVVSPFLIQNFPDTASFLTPEERAYCVARLAASSGEDTTGEKFSWQPIKDSLTDWKTYIGCVIYVGCDAPLYAFSLFTPSIIFVFKLFISPASVSAGRARCRQVLVLTSSLLLSNRNELGYSSIRANLISVPCYASACIVTVGLGFYADRTHKRGIYNLIFMAIGLVGYLILILSRKPGLSYFAIYLAAWGIYPMIPNTIAWVSNNTEGAYKRSLTLALVIGFGNLNGAVSSNIYRGKDKPRYLLGHGIVLAYIALGFIASASYMILLKRENAARDRGERDELIEDDGSPETVKGEKRFNAEGKRVFRSVEEARRELGDKHSSFRYVI